ncbi:hypothetical protein ACIRPK_07305 [Kitasatospora sp. NPDC101801]|uniref:hypothetical protein n=1 Tax=Kitasatospora sp. NPDC101801 TaxID=3364103 RepID=UPI00382861B9
MSSRTLLRTPVKVPLDTALAAARSLRATGVTVTVTVDCAECHRTVPADGALLDPAPCAALPWLITAHCRANNLTRCDCGHCTAIGPLRTYTA